MVSRRLALVALRDGPAGKRLAASVASLGFVMHQVDEATEPTPADRGGATVYARPVLGDDPRRLYECAARLRDRLAVVRPAIARLRSVLSDARDAGAATRRDFVELAAADEMMTKLEVLRGLPSGHYRRRMERIVGAEQGASRASGGPLAGMVDEDTLRSAIKQDLRGDVLSYLDELDDAGSYQMLREFTDKLNNSDLGNLAEDWYSRRYAVGGEQHARASKEALARGKPPIEIERTRFIDNLSADGTAIEIKSITGQLSGREVEQLDDYLKMAKGEAKAGEMGRRVQKIRYTFTRPEGLKENLDTIEDLLGDPTTAGLFSCEVFLKSGRRVSIDNLGDLNAIKASL